MLASIENGIIGFFPSRAWVLSRCLPVGIGIFHLVGIFDRILLKRAFFYHFWDFSLVFLVQIELILKIGQFLLQFLGVAMIFLLSLGKNGVSFTHIPEIQPCFQIFVQNRRLKTLLYVFYAVFSSFSRKFTFFTVVQSRIWSS